MLGVEELMVLTMLAIMITMSDVGTFEVVKC